MNMVDGVEQTSLIPRFVVIQRFIEDEKDGNHFL